MLTVLAVSLALTCVESALYGIFFVLAVTSLVVLVVRHGKDMNVAKSKISFWGAVHSPLVIATVMLLITVSSHWFVTVRRLFYAFIVDNAGKQPATFFSMIEATSHVAATVFVIASVIVGDIILTYRIWVVCGRRLITIVFPTLCTMAYTAAGISVVQLFAVFSPGEDIFGINAQRRIIMTAALTLSTNIYGTISIAYRIWSSNRLMKYDRMMVPGLSMAEALVILVESAALYTFWAFFFLVSYSASSILYAFAFHCITAATGISFMLIIVRVGLGFSWAESAHNTLSFAVPYTSNITSNANRPGLGRRQVGGARQDHGNGRRLESPPDYSLRMIALNVTHTVERETDFALPQTGNKRDAQLDITKDQEV